MRSLFRGISLILIMILTVGLVGVSGVGEKSVLAAEDYSVITEESEMIPAEWRFADGLYEEAPLNLTEVSAIMDGKVQTGYTYTVKNEEAFAFQDGKYTLAMDISLSFFGTNSGKKNALLNGRLEHDWEPDCFNIKRIEDDENSPYFIELRPNVANFKDTDYKIDLKVWLEDDLGEKIDPYSEEGVPFIIGASQDGESQISRIYTIDNKYYTNVSEDIIEWKSHGEDEHFGLSCFNPEKTLDSIYYFLSGEGYNEDNQIEHTYVRGDLDGACRIRVGYKAYSITFSEAEDSRETVVSVPDSEFVPVLGDTQNPKVLAIETKPGYEVDYYEVANIYNGENEPDESEEAKDEAESAEYIEDGEGARYTVGSVIPSEKLSSLKMTKNVLLIIHTKAAGLEEVVTEPEPEAIVPQQEEPEPEEIVVVPGTVNVEFVSPLGDVPGAQSKLVGQTADKPGTPENPSDLVEGVLMDGYRFEGWYKDRALRNKYDFNEPLTEDIKLYAKWIRVGRNYRAGSPRTGDDAVSIYLVLLISLLLAYFGSELTMYIHDKKIK